MDLIRIKNLKILASHGLYEDEKKVKKIFEIDLELSLLLNVAGKSDQINDTIDYAHIVEKTTEAFTSKNYLLVEAAAESIATSMLNNFNFEKVIVRVRKPHAPINAEFDTIEIEIIRQK